MSAIDRINALTADAFVEKLGSLYEHSPWAAARAFADHPFADADALLAAMRNAVDEASGAEIMALIRAHPELAGEKLRTKALTASSLSEQQGAGLDQLSSAEIKDWASGNAAYVKRFGFPFIICVRLHDRATILSELRRRLTSTPDAEREEALKQIHDIARLRLTDLLEKLQ